LTESKRPITFLSDGDHRTLGVEQKARPAASVSSDAHYRLTLETSDGNLLSSDDEKGNAQKYDDRCGCHAPAGEREQWREGPAPALIGDLLFGDGGIG
jgi:hypothetical protein